VRQLHASRFGRHVRRHKRPALLEAYLLTPMRFVFAADGFAGRLLDWARTILRTTLWGSLTGDLPAVVGLRTLRGEG
jgi:hypothetical protein